jgi:hypothetical protein
MPLLFIFLAICWAFYERWLRFQHKEQAEAELYKAHAQNLRLCRRLLAERKGDTPEIRKQVFEFCRYNPPDLVYLFAVGSEEDQRRDEPPFDQPNGSFSDRRA